MVGSYANFVVEKDMEVLLGRVKDECDSMEEAVDYLDDFIDDNPDRVEAYLVRGTLRMELGHFDDAIADTKKAMAIAPDIAEPYNLRGMLRAMSNDIDGAFADFNKAIGLNPNDSQSYCNRANMYLKKRDPHGAIADCTKAIELAPEEMEPYFNRGLAYMNLEAPEVEKALKDYDRVIELAPDNAEAYGQRGFMRSALNNVQGAISDYEKFLALDPGNVKAAMAQDEIRKLKGGRTSGGGGCYVATCVYGSYDCPEVWTLRRYRDGKLSASWFGRLFIWCYYAVSPKIVELFGDKKWFYQPCKWAIDKFVGKLQCCGIDNDPYSDM